MARDRHKTYFTLRERIAREHWLFSQVGRYGATYRKRMYGAIPFQLDETLSNEYWQHAHHMRAGNDRNKHDPWTASLTEDFHELPYWHMPACLLWAETVDVPKLVEGRIINPYIPKRVGCLYYSNAKYFSAASNHYDGDTPKDMLTRKGSVFMFVEIGDKILTIFGYFANGDDAISKMAGDRPVITSPAEDPERPVFSAMAYGKRVRTFEDTYKAMEAWSNPREFETNLMGLRDGRDEVTELFYPFLRIFNATPTKAIVRHHKGYQSTDQFAGKSFTTLGNKHVCINLGLDRIIQMSFDEETVVATGRRKALEFVRGYWRTRKNGVLLPNSEWKWVDAFERGDPSLGISQRSYEYIRDYK